METRDIGSLLHVRGGVSNIDKTTEREYSVFSTSVEVFLVVREPVERFLRLLHVRGGVSRHSRSGDFNFWSSPRPWRCFRSPFCLRQGADVFSTSVEVFLSTFGDRSPASQSSPRPWRCFHHDPARGVPDGVFSTSVEVFPCEFGRPVNSKCLLHVRGGVS